MNNKNDILDNARNLGNSITQSIEYQNIIKAEEDYLNDTKLEKIIKELEFTKNMYDSATNLEDHEVNMYKAQIRHLEEVLANSNTLNNLKEAKDKYDKIFKNINNIISYLIDEDSRIKVDLNSNKKDCSSCSGCSKK